MDLDMRERVHYLQKQHLKQGRARAAADAEET